MIRQPWLAAVAILLVLVGIVFALRQASFMLTAKRTTGTVTRVEARNATCGSKRNRHSCTEFTSIVAFQTLTGIHANTTVTSGSVRGHGAPESRASHPMGSSVPIIYSPGNPERAYRDSLFDVWFAPLASFGGAIATGLGSMSEGRRRRYGNW